ncbi:MAG: hypothetical protein EOP48_12705 [Sphingobacteriales bacterium]|nr:MAG: hypothetical protein EOP48_12705 [Sphingobacteriales bacterium]
MLLKGARKSVLVGRRTAGADGDLSYIPMIGRNKIVFRMTNVGVEFPNGMKTQQIGILPDITVEETQQHNIDQIFSATLSLIK